MQIPICLYGVFCRDRFSETLRELLTATRVREVVTSLDFPDQLFGIILAKGVHAVLDDVLREGDVLSLLPMVAGGVGEIGRTPWSDLFNS